MSANPPQFVYRTKFAAAAPTYEVDVGIASVQVWQPNSTVGASELRRPSTDTESADGLDHSTGFVYQNGTTPGQTGQLEPGWVTTGTVSDGSCTWTPLAPPATSQSKVQSATATLVDPPDSALAVGQVTSGELTVNVPISGGTAGETYTVQIAVTMTDGEVLVIQLVVTVE
ncbi:MAG: hypothetical protein ACP5P4_08125 [Steroidobacteraceae bacterium]